MKHKLLLGMVSALLLVACQAQPLPSQSSVNLRQQATGASGRQVLRADALSFQQPVAVEIEPNRLIFTTPQPGIKPNQVLMGRSLKEQDFLRRARQIHSEGNRLIVDTVPATLFEAFAELDYTGASAVRAPENIQLRSQHFNLGGVVDIVLDLGVRPDFSDAHLRLKDSRLFVRVAPRFTLDAKVHAEYNFLKSRAPLGNEPVLQPVGDYSFNAVRLPAWIGPVPLVFHLKPGTRLDFGHHADGKLIASTELTGEFKASVEMEAALGESPVTKTDSDYSFDGKMLPPELRLTGVGKARLHLPTLHLDTEIAGLVGPFVEASPYVDGRYQKTLTATPQQTTVFTSAKASLGLAIDGGLTPTTLFGKQLSHEIRLRILDKQIKVLYSKEGTDILPGQL